MSKEKCENLKKKKYQPKREYVLNMYTILKTVRSFKGIIYTLKTIFPNKYVFIRPSGRERSQDSATRKSTTARKIN